MKFLIINNDYRAFTHWLYEQHPGLETRSYDEQLRVRMENLFGIGGFYSSNLRKLGHEAHSIIANNEILQKQWASENGLKIKRGRRLRDKVQLLRCKAGKTPLRYLRPVFKPVLKPFDTDNGLPYEILAAQIKAHRPDVLYSIDIAAIGSDFLRSVKDYYRLAVGQHSAILPSTDISEYDLILSSLPNQVNYFRSQGLPSELFRLAFESSILSRLSKGNSTYDVVHIGGFGTVHKERNLFLEDVSRQVDIDFWGYGIEDIPPDSAIRRNYRGEAWGVEMYEVRYNSKISLNKHITTVASRFANNCTLYEATGTGSLLLTDYKDNLGDIFEVGKEVVAYHNVGECVELMRYYLEHDREREAIAQAGQRRTLREHTYEGRMRELIDIVSKYL